MGKRNSDSIILILSILTTTIILQSGNRVLAQNCGCASGLCCSIHGYCGTGTEYCGSGCQAGPCFGPPSTNGAIVSDIVTDAFFNRITSQPVGPCPGRGFYTRRAFLDALRFYPNFGTVGSADDSRREIAAFFAHVTHETGFMCYIEERNGANNNYCYTNYPQYPCSAGRTYYGRGPLQLTWNYNYGAAGNSIKFDGLSNPQIVATDPVISFRTALWYWMNNCHDAINSGRGFGATIRAINGPTECDGRDSSSVGARVQYYTRYCSDLQVDPGNNLGC